MTINFGHTAWILTSTALVLFMTLPGLALFYGGLVRSKNTISVLAQCFLIAALTSIIWVVMGYSLSFSGEGLYIGNLDKFFLRNIKITNLTGEIPELLFVIFQMTFAIITPGLIIGAFAERIKFSAVFLFTLLWIIFVYTPVAHWVWGNGWLAKKGVLDFAGGLVVHTTAGISSLVIAYFLGKRKGFPKITHPPHSPVLVMIGASMLWVGWFGFNAGSALAANGNAAMAMLVTHSSAATASLTWMSIDWYKNGKPGLIGIVTGMVAGLATVTPASGYIGPMGGIILGLLSGFICYWSVGFVKFKLKIDDSLDVFAVHGVGGILGTLLTGILATDTFGGLGIEKSTFDQTVTQFIGIISIAFFSLFITIIIVKIIQATIGLRVSSNQEEFDGLDLGSHGEKSYNL